MEFSVSRSDVVVFLKVYRVMQLLGGFDISDIEIDVPYVELEIFTGQHRKEWLTDGDAATAILQLFQEAAA